MDQTQVKQTNEVFSKLQFVTLNKYIKSMQLLYLALITNQWQVVTDRRKNKIKMDWYYQILKYIGHIWYTVEQLVTFHDKPLWI